MRRYSPRSGSLTLGRLLVFFGAWNIIGVTVYKYVIKREEEKEPGKWETASGVQHYLRFIGFGSEDVEKITVKGVSSITRENLSKEEVQKIKGYEKTESE